MRLSHFLICLWPALLAQGLEPLPIVLPKPMFEGTPVDIKVPNLEEPLDQPRPPFLAPAGTVNDARGKPVISSDMNPAIGRLNQITDGDKEGYDGSYVELKGGVQHITIDLRARHVIYAVLFWHYHQQPRVDSGLLPALFVALSPVLVLSQACASGVVERSARSGRSGAHHPRDTGHGTKARRVAL